jgi:hypothetical protein
MRRRKFNMPSYWYSWEHLQVWINFLHARYREELLTDSKLREKIRLARLSAREQARRYGMRELDDYGCAMIRREMAAKLKSKSAQL